MPELLQNQAILGGAIVGLIILILLGYIIMRRRRVDADNVVPPPEFGQAIDYTSLQEEEPQTAMDRFKALPLPAKLLIIVAPLVLITALVIALLAFTSPPEVAEPPPPPPEISDVAANVSGNGKILVQANTLNLPNGSWVNVALNEGDQPFTWIDTTTASAQVFNGKVQMTVLRAQEAEAPSADETYYIIVSTEANGQTFASEPAELDVPQPLRDSFYGSEVAAEPTPAPTRVPTAAPTAAPAAPTATPEPTPEPKPALTATVFNGGNIREQPVVTACTCPQLHAGQTVELLEKTANAAWYHVVAPEGTGWVSATLLTIDPEVAAQVPIQGQAAPTAVPTSAPSEDNADAAEDEADEEAADEDSGLTATIFNGGRIRERPVTGQVLGMVHAGQSVSLLEKTSDGQWYRVKAPEATGWIHLSLLTMDASVAAQVPIAP